MKWYKQSIEEVLTKVDSQTTGLSKEEREARLKNNGPNKMEEKEQNQQEWDFIYLRKF